MTEIVEDLTSEVDRVTDGILKSLNGENVPIAMIALVNCAALLIKQMPEQNHNAALEEAVDMLMGFMGYGEIDPDELQNATRH
jgi:hypothetical protein